MFEGESNGNKWVVKQGSFECKGLVQMETETELACITETGAVTFISMVYSEQH